MLEWLENTPFSAWVRDAVWGWPVALTIHEFGTALVVGFVLIIGLRLLGFFALLPYTVLFRLFPVIWVALALQLLSGLTLWMARPTRYVADVAFVLKSSLVLIGAIMTLYVYRTIRREAASWQANGAVSSRGVEFVGAAVLLWCGVLVASRLTGYLGSV